jgi:hypothetical protein
VLTGCDDDILANAMEKFMFQKNGIAFMIKLSLEGRGQFSYNLGFNVFLAQISGLIVVSEISIDPMDQIDPYILVPHVDVDCAES